MKGFVPSSGSEDTAKLLLRRTSVKLSPRSQSHLNTLMESLYNGEKLHRFSIKESLRNYDKYKTGRVTKIAFFQHFPGTYTTQDLELLFMKYGDNSTQDFNYMSLCRY